MTKDDVNKSFSDLRVSIDMLFADYSLKNKNLIVAIERILDCCSEKHMVNLYEDHTVIRPVDACYYAMGEIQAIASHALGRDV